MRSSAGESSKTTLSSDLLMVSPSLYSMNPSRLTRDGPSRPSSSGWQPRRGTCPVTAMRNPHRMTNPDLLWNAPRPVPRPVQPGEPMWTRRKGERRLTCELRVFACGAEVQLLVNGGFYAGRRHASREAAVRAAAVLRARLDQAGWTDEADGRQPER